MSEDNVTTRKCKNCKEPYPLTLEWFPPHGKDKQGNQLFRPYCRECWRKHDRDYHATPEAKEAKRQSRKRRDPEKVKAEKKRNRQKHPEANKRRVDRFLANHPDYLKQQHIKHKDANVARATKWVEDNRERFNAAQRRRRQENPILKMKESVIRHKRRARMRQAEGTYTHEDVRRIFEEQNERCAYCGITLFWNIPYDIHIDHIRPLARGGSNWPDNLNCSCAECNLSKGDKTIPEWMATRGW